MNYLKKFLRWAYGEKNQLIAGVICAILLVWGLSCESQVWSIRNPTQKITRSELDIEVENFLAIAKQRYEMLDQQDELKVLMFERLSLWTQTGVFNPVGMIPALVSILGIGAIADNAVNRRTIKKLNKKTA